MGCIEEEVFSKFEKPETYCRYIDDIFIKTAHNEDIILLKNYLQDASGLTLTIENSVEGSMPFLDILVKQQQEKFDTDTYVKPTNTGQYMNGKSECPQRYINSTISAYISRALTHCSTWTKVHTEIVRSTQVLLNNGFDKKDIETITKKIIDRWYHTQQDTTEKKEDIKIYYRAFFCMAYKEDERILKQIIKRNVKPTNPEKRINVVIYYKSQKTSHLLLRNSPNMIKEPTQQSHVIYRFTCKRGNCATLPSTYVGMTTMKLSRRLSYHLSSGAPKTHLRQEHHENITRQMLTENTEIITTCPDTRRLPILEALYIKELNPNLNIQSSDLQALPSIRRNTAPSTSQSETRRNETDDTSTP
ncbi:uncharacterized protein LOC143034295 [Oratosquilla oratoria]|uniref:uncharacterized protein LOC143034295 n=1 Tax=Oratosquilla oratoria TaxID=337810 RepID=UPI003F75A861